MASGAIGIEEQERSPALEVLFEGVAEVGVEGFFGQCQGTVVEAVAEVGEGVLEVGVGEGSGGTEEADGMMVVVVSCCCEGEWW